MEEQEREPLNVLHVEDSVDDALLVEDALRMGGYQTSWRRVETASQMRLALEQATWQLIISDHRLPGFSAMEAFEIYQQFGLDIPFLIVSGVIGEDAAVAAMRAGVHDYLNKGNLARLAPAVRRELREAESRLERRRAESALRTAYSELAAIHANAPVLLAVLNEDCRVERANELAGGFSGRDAEEMTGLAPGGPIGCLNHVDDPRGCGYGPACRKCPVRLAVLDTLRNGTRHDNLEVSLPVRGGDDGRRQRWLLVSSTLMGADQPRKVLICAQDISELKHAQIKVERQHDALRLQAELINLSHDAIITADANGIIQGWNKGAEEMYGWTEAEARGRKIQELLETSYPAPAGAVDQSLSQPDLWGEELVYTGRDGRQIIVESRRVVLRGSAGNPSGILIINRDVTEKNRAEKALRASEERLHLAQQIGRIGTFEWNLQTGESRWTPEMEALFGLAPGDFPGSHEAFARMVHPDDLQELERVVRATPDEAGETEWRIIWPDGSVRWVAGRWRTFNDQAGRPLRVVGANIDITERKRTEEILKDTVREVESALAEKTVLLKEVHHRVKNNLAVISSLLGMQAEVTDGPEAKLALEESQQRVQSIALIHEHLYGTDHLDRINFTEYARELVGVLYNTLVGKPEKVSLDIEADPLEIGVHQAVPCALILNELITNAFKYAFPGDRRGRVSITCREIAPRTVQVVVSDDGIGMPADLDWRRANSLGLHIVQILVRQLGATIELRRDHGTRFEVTFQSGSPG